MTYKSMLRLPYNFLFLVFRGSCLGRDHQPCCQQQKYKQGARKTFRLTTCVVFKFRPGQIARFFFSHDVFVPLDVTTRASIDAIYRRFSLCAELSVFEIDAVMFTDSAVVFSLHGTIALRRVT
jgi:hypothetical protein